MHMQCAKEQLHFQGLGSRRIVASFDGGTITSDGGGLLLRETDLGRYHRIFHDAAAIEEFFVEHFQSHYNAGCQPGQIILDLDATGDPMRQRQQCTRQGLEGPHATAAVRHPWALACHESSPQTP